MSAAAGHGLLALMEGRGAVQGADDAVEASPSLLLAMLAVAIKQGTSIPRALEAVGSILAGPAGHGLCRAADGLMRGLSWEEAWWPPDQEERPRVLDEVGGSLLVSWQEGSSPMGRLASAIERIGRQERAAIEETCARLSVSLLLPTGLCFLPAFMLIGVLPGIASLGG
ncbi:type II secretion system F family protein [Bifidobacterium aemilianum]|uniref:type II secretion system F family protein n=1 Tax=Bifidobacterium aemilianum TaxID=2493120 RepID=UPI001374EC34|nr:type II secretion system F family protein [Bifidobacterium aemilianum]